MSEAHYREQGASSAEILALLACHGYTIRWLRASAPIPKTTDAEFDNRFVGMLVAVRS
jgi:hypothetical protein